jgi:hypothetical protein
VLDRIDFVLTNAGCQDCFYQAIVVNFTAAEDEVAAFVALLLPCLPRSLTGAQVTLVDRRNITWEYTLGTTAFSFGFPSHSCVLFDRFFPPWAPGVLQTSAIEPPMPIAPGLFVGIQASENWNSLGYSSGTPLCTGASPSHFGDLNLPTVGGTLPVGLTTTGLSASSGYCQPWRVHFRELLHLGTDNLALT